jgi:hypothetical protein
MSTDLAIRRRRVSSVGPLDLQHVPCLVAVGQAVEGTPGRRLCIQRGGQVGRHTHLPWGGVELDVDIHLLAASDAGTVVGVDPDHVAAARHRYGAAVGVAVEGP